MSSVSAPRGENSSKKVPKKAVWRHQKNPANMGQTWGLSRIRPALSRIVPHPKTFVRLMLASISKHRHDHVRRAEPVRGRASGRLSNS